MRLARIASLTFVIALIFAGVATAQITQDQIRISTPTSPWTLVFEGKRLSLRDVKVKATEGSGYFLMVDESADINVSLYVEPVDGCKSADECRDYVLGLGNPAWGKYQDLAKGKVGNFSYFEFFRPEVQGRPLKMHDMYAQYVEKGYWIDLHISKVLYKKEDHLLIEELIKRIKFVPKDGKTETIEPVREKIDAAAKSWLQVWDNIGCKETYASLTSIAKEAVTEEQWTPYCQELHKDLGKLESRKPVASALIKSLSSHPTLAGAQLRYRSVFQNATIVEIVTLTQEKDGRWTVSNYLPN